MRPLLHTSIFFAAIAFVGCATAPPESEIVPLTTRALERIPELRKTGADRADWEVNLTERLEAIETIRQLRSILAPWELSKQEIDHWASQFERATKVTFYGTDLDGRLLIFYDRHDRSFATWASWDPSRKNEEVEQAAP